MVETTGIGIAQPETWQTRTAGNNPEQYQRIFWGGYKHHVRGMLTGVSLGTLVGGAIGLATMAIFPPLGLLGVAAFAGAGALTGAEQLSSIGTASGSRAASLAESHASALDPANEGDQEKILKDRLMNFDDYHYQGNPERKRSWFQWKSGTTGALVGMAAGALIGIAAEAEIPVIATLIGGGVLGLSAAAAPIVAGALVFGLLGLTFGIDRGIFGTVFNKIDSFVNGRKKGKEGHEQFIEQEKDPRLKERRMEREEMIHDLHMKYDEKIFMGGIKGYLQGGLGGSLIGAVTGAVVGGLLALTAVHLALPIIGATIIAGAIFGAKTFAEAGYNAGTEAITRTIDDEFKLRELQKQKGIDTTVEENIDKGRKRIPGMVFDGALNTIGAISSASKAVYNNVYDIKPENPVGATATVPGFPEYKITPEEAAELNRKLERNPQSTPETILADRRMSEEQRNFSDTIAQQKMKPVSAAIQ
ncbi:MAG TPA: hypothetical protein VFT64_07995 [Rickettsiales bacterium]|nr:hypothetical protein [Rickettsiales bacterium]